MKFVLFVTLIWSIPDSGWSITDEDLMRIEAGLSQIQVLTNEMLELKNENQDLRKENRAGQTQIQALTKQVKELRQFKTEQQTVNKLLLSHLEAKCGCDNELVQDDDLAQNTTIEERVTLLELQMTEVQEEVLQLQDDVDFLFDEQVIQDERILNVEERTLILEQDTEDLDERVEVLEANGGGGGNVTALEERVETLEGTAAQHEADITDLDSAVTNLDGRVETLEGETSELATRVTAVETLIEDLQATDVELDSRISDLEEGGGGGATNGMTIAFRAVMDETDDDNIPDESTVIFSDVQVNEGNGYDPATGVFTVPSGGEGYYFFASHFTVNWNQYAYIDIRVNDITVCTMRDENEDTPADPSNGGCNTVVFLQEGDEVKNVYWAGTDSTPVYEYPDGVYNGFTGFRI